MRGSRDERRATALQANRLHKRHISEARAASPHSARAVCENLEDTKSNPNLPQGLLPELVSIPV